MVIRYRSVLLFTLSVCFLTPFNTALCQDDDEPKPIFGLGKKPFVVLTAGSVQRLKEDAEFLFETAEYPDAVETIMGALEDNVNGLEGLNWDNPGGVMVFLDSVFPPAFEFVAFAPISSTDEFITLMESRQALMREESGETGRYELIAPRGNLQVRIQGDYAFLQLPVMNPDPAFERELPDPAGFAAALGRKYDLSLSLDVEAVPKPTRDLIFNVLSSMMSTQHQQRDDEADSTYAVRDAWQQRDIAGLKMFFRDTQRITVGVNLDRESNGADLDIVLDAREASEMLEEIFLSSTKPSYFTPLITDETPVSISYSALLAERDREAFGDVFESLKGWVSAQVEEDGDLGNIPDQSSPVFHALDSFNATLKEGHLDLFAQFYNDSDEKLCVVGGLRVEDGDAIAAGLQDVLMRLQGKENIGEVEIGANEHADVKFHRIEFNNPDAGALKLFGSGPGLTFGSGSRTAWACVGGDASFDTLSGVMDALVAAYENPVDRDSPASVRLVVNFTQLKDLIEGAESAKREARAQDNDGEQSKGRRTAATDVKITKGDDDKTGKSGPGNGDGFRPGGGRQGGGRAARRAESGRILMETLAEGEDRIRADFRPTDKGMRFRVHFDLGFVRAVGRIIGARVEGS